MKINSILALLVTFLLLSGCSVKKSDSKGDFSSVSSDSSNSTINTEISDFTTETSSVNENSEIFRASSSDVIAQADYDAVYSLCNKVFESLSKLSRNAAANSFEEYLLYPASYNYFVYEFVNFPVQLPRSSVSEFIVESYETSGKLAYVKGRYTSSSGSIGSFIFIIENCNSTLFVNDIITDIIDAADLNLRPECVSNPVPDFWKVYDNYASILEAVKLNLQ